MSLEYAITESNCNNYSANGKFTVTYLTDGSTIILLDTDVFSDRREHTYTYVVSRMKKVANKIHLEAYVLQVQNCVCNIGPQIQYSIVQGILSGRKRTIKASL